MGMPLDPGALTLMPSCRCSDPTSSRTNRWLSALMRARPRAESLLSARMQMDRGWQVSLVHNACKLHAAPYTLAA